MNTHKGFLALLGAAFIFSFFGVFVRWLDLMFGEFSQVSFRNLFAGVIFLVWAIKKGQSFKIPRKKVMYVLLFSVVFPLSVLFWTFGVTMEKASNVLFMFYIGSVFTSLVVGTVFYKEKVTHRKIASIVLVVLGLIFIGFPFAAISLGLLFGILAGTIQAFTNALRKYLGDLPRETVLFYQYALGGLFMLALTFLSGEQMVKEINYLSLATLVIFGISHVILGKLLMYGFNHFDVNIGSTILASEIFFGLVVNFIFLTEIPTLLELIGGFTIFGAAALAYR